MLCNGRSYVMLCNGKSYVTYLVIASYSSNVIQQSTFLVIDALPVDSCTLLATAADLACDGNLCL